MARPIASSILCAFTIVFVALLAVAQDICSVPECKCTQDRHPFWTAINCTMQYNKKLDILEGDLPNATTDLVITGAEAVVFGTNSLSRLKDARRLRVDGAKLIVIRKFAAVNLNIINFYLDVEGCDSLRIEEKAFTNVKGPVSVRINNCGYVFIEGQAFSWLLSADIQNVRELKLGSGAFVLDPTAANIGEHGPGLTIGLMNLSIPEILSQTFGSSAASITMQSVTVHAIRTEAFTANTYNVLSVVNCTFDIIDQEAFAQKSLINTFQIHNTNIQTIAGGAIKSGVANLNVSHSTIETVESGAISLTVATVTLADNVFGTFNERALELYSWNIFIMERNKFDEIAANGIVATGANVHELTFVENEIETVHEKSLGFIGEGHISFRDNVKYKNNYYGQQCHCSVESWIFKVLDTEASEPFTSESYCTVVELLARCFNVPEQIMNLRKYVSSVCGEDRKIDCVPYKSQHDSEIETKSPRFPHKGKEKGLTSRNAKVIGIIIISAFGCALVALLITLIKWMRRRGHCLKIKNFISSSPGCGVLCGSLCSCTERSGLDSARSISQLSVNDYSERHRLNEARPLDATQETLVPGVYSDDPVSSEDKTTQTLPEELTKELLESLKQKLDDPDNYAEARETIEHLYELIKVEESCNSNKASAPPEENIYELPFQNTAPRLGKNKRQMISVGTRMPSLDKLSPLSPYNRPTALAHEYFEPKDLAVHLYAEIANYDKDKRNKQSTMPDIVAEQAVPRGPYLRAKMTTNSNPTSKSINNLIVTSPSPQNTSTIRSNKSNKSTSSNTSGPMINRPLPVKPIIIDVQGQSFSNRHG